VSVRPTLPEQLRGLRRILDQVVAPAVDGDYERSTLEGVIRALEMLEQRANDAVPFLVWDNDQTLALLRSIAAHVPLDGAIEPPSPVEPSDVVALDAENERVRGLLAAAVPSLARDRGASEVYAHVIAHLRARVSRFPFTSTASLPSR